MEQELKQWIELFRDRRAFSAPEVFSINYLLVFTDIYEQDIRGVPNPTKSTWFAELLKGTPEQIEELETYINPNDMVSRAVIRFLQTKILTVTESPAVKNYFRKKGWTVRITINEAFQTPATGNYYRFYSEDTAVARIEGKTYNQYYVDNVIMCS
jgi:hypothetical protein